MVRQTIYILDDPVEGSCSPDVIISCGRPSIQTHLEIEHLPSLEEFQNLVINKGPIGADTGNETLLVAGIEDGKEISPDKGFSTPKVNLKDLKFGKLIDQTQTLIEGELPLFSPSGPGEAMDTREIALVRHLPGHIDRGG
jgi:hypothetical protein